MFLLCRSHDFISGHASLFKRLPVNFFVFGFHQPKMATEDASVYEGIGRVSTDPFEKEWVEHESIKLKLVLVVYRVSLQDAWIASSIALAKRRVR